MSVIVMEAPGAGLTFGSMPSGTIYRSDANGLIIITNGSIPDQLALIAGGCQTLSANASALGSLSIADAQAAPGTGTILPVSIQGVAGGLPVGTTDTNLLSLGGAAGATPPALASGASGLIGWARKIVDTLTGTLPISASALPLPAGAATSTAQAAGNTTLSSILSQLQTQRVETVWTDDTGTYFVRLDNSGTISWATPSGATSSGPGAGARPVGGAGVASDSTRWQATAAVAGSYSVGDYLSHIVTVDPATDAVLGNFWINTTTAAALSSAPSAANISPIDPLPTNAAQETGGNLAAIAAAQGTPGTGITQPTGGSGILGWLSGLLKAATSTGLRFQNSDGSLVNFNSAAQVYSANVSYSGTTPFSVAAAGFSGNEYLDGSTANSTGFDISQCAGVSIAFSGTYTGQSVVPEQTSDPSGLTGWVAVAANTWTNNGTATPSSGGATFSVTGQTYAFPAFGVRMRFRVTSMSTGTLQAGITLLGSRPEREATVANLKPFSSGGLTALRVVTGTAGIIKAASGQIFGYRALNTTATVVYLQFYQKTTTPVPGTDMPYMTIGIAANGAAGDSDDLGTAFYPGIGWAITTDAAGTTAASSGAVVFTTKYF